jgi:3',5'-cyclic AMP phosphodiesterase CpdA
MPDATTLAHLSDLHLTPLAGFAPAHWNVKRTLGLINWHRGRRKVHRIEVVEQLLADLAMHTPEHIAVTGDLCNIGLPSEYEVALAWLTSLGTPEQVSVVPGNHDIYTRLRSSPGVELWRDFMRSDAFGAALGAADGAGAHPLARGFPYVRRIGRLALVGVNSAVETPPFVSGGEVGGAQRTALGRLLDALAGSGLARVVMIHHPPLGFQAPPRRGLADAAALEKVLATHGAELVLHGHNHRDTLVWCDGAAGRIPVLGIASGSAMRGHKGEALGRYNLIRVRGGPDEGGWRIEVVGRGFASPSSGVVELDRQVLHV